ncbi:MAG TPA: CDP-diacylglycerol--glycerol-3-phosphate 3-phosphatidyltransferase [Spirochaetota bacterium]|nr:CDP-diacylglycerol--glycerol-3-phosphate 3-phosphatidyltransferase [Spirochaetota bacterium]
MIKKEYINIANILTLSRIILGIIFFFLFFFILKIDKTSIIIIILKLITLLIFIIAIITDGLDGYFARKNKEVTDFGKHFDPLADSIFFIIVFFSFFYIGIMPFYFFLIVLFREMFMHLFLRPIIKRKGGSLPANIYGKIKTIFQSVFSIIILTTLFLIDFIEILLPNSKIVKIVVYISNIVFYIFFVIIVFLSLLSLIIYIFQIKDKLKS